MELFKLGIKSAKEGLEKGDFSSVELVQSIIGRVHAKDGEIGAYLTFDEEGADSIIICCRNYRKDRACRKEQICQKKKKYKANIELEFLIKISRHQ